MLARLGSAKTLFIPLVLTSQPSYGIARLHTSKISSLCPLLMLASSTAIDSESTRHLP